MRVISPPGSASRPRSSPPAAPAASGASPSAATATCACCSPTAPARSCAPLVPQARPGAALIRYAPGRSPCSCAATTTRRLAPLPTSSPGSAMPAFAMARPTARCGARKRRSLVAPSQSPPERAVRPTHPHHRLCRGRSPIMATRVTPAPTDADNSAGSAAVLSALARCNDWRVGARRFHVGTGHPEPTHDAGYTTAGAPSMPVLSISLFLCEGSPYTGLDRDVDVLDLAGWRGHRKTIFTEPCDMKFDRFTDE